MAHTQIQAGKESHKSFPVQNVNSKIIVKDRETQELIQQALEKLGPTVRKVEPYCVYSYEFEVPKEKVIVKQYHKGTLQFQGRARALYKEVLGMVLRSYNLNHPEARLTENDFISYKTEKETSNKTTGEATPLTVALPHIGTDESGKGDYFGPMVIAGVWLDQNLKQNLEYLGVKDSKKLSDRNCRELASDIRTLCRGKFQVVEIPPHRYNALYQEFRKEGKNLNHLLAWGHARAIESLLERHPCSWAVADQFGNERYIESRLMDRGKKIELIQTHRGERFTAVAAASILARDRFLAGLEKLSHHYGINLPKGASKNVVSTAKQFVVRHGPQALDKVGKLHHKTTQTILGKS